MLYDKLTCNMSDQSVLEINAILGDASAVAELEQQRNDVLASMQDEFEVG